MRAINQKFAFQFQPGQLTWDRTAADEAVNTATHALGFLLAAMGGLVMAGSVLGHGDVWRVVGCGVYLSSLLAVYAMSTLSHGATSPGWKSWFRRLDQAFIYLLIAATYTPFSLAYLRSPGWWVLLGAIWLVALWGFVSKLLFAHRVEAVSIVSYVLLGWMPIMAVPALWHTLPLGAFLWMLAGGVCYSLGTLFLTYDQRVRHFHAVWHLCVIAGSACHFLGILLFVVKAAA
jgi:hemolysin III